MALKCPHCRETNYNRARFCHKCGQLTARQAQPIPRDYYTEIKWLLRQYAELWVIVFVGSCAVGAFALWGLWGTDYKPSNGAAETVALESAATPTPTPEVTPAPFAVSRRNASTRRTPARRQSLATLPELAPPAPPDDNPSGATALCRDGTLSFSAHRSGTCSRHGGVARWY